MKSGLVSVVVPIYKVEKYLDRCIKSIVEQTYRELEIILVDDGSPDNCPQICDEWAERDNRIKVIHKENGGIGMARNSGMEQATGEYICFFDSDDYIEPETIESAYHAALANDADMVCFGINSVNSNGVKVGSEIPRNVAQVYRAEAVRDDFLPRMIGPDPTTGDDCGIPLSACSKLFSMRSIRRNNWRFVSEREIISEDFYSLLQLMPDIETVCVLPYGYYNYCCNDASISHSYRRDRFEKVCEFYAEMKKLCRELGFSQEVKHRLAAVYLAAVMAVMKQEAACEKGFAEKRKAIAAMVCTQELQQVLEEIKNDRVSIQQKALFWGMRHRWSNLCYVLLVIKNKMESEKDKKA